MSFFKDFHFKERLIKSINYTFVVLIPKSKDAQDLKDFRSISLTDNLYKHLGKVLANRLKKFMKQLVNKAQNAFVEGRQILNASLIANKLIDSILKKKETEASCRLDIEKAYDQTN